MVPLSRFGTGRYHLTSSLGKGAMGHVSRAWDRLSEHAVALKQVYLPPDLAPDDIAAALLALAHEFRVLAGLRHPHIISVLDYGFDTAQQPFYTMELLAEAHTILEAGQPLPLTARVNLLLQALEALAYLHRRGILHHDLKPANMLVVDGRIRLLDFGLAVLADQPRANDAFGTLQYLAPEVLDDQPYHEAADLYSLGVIAYELLLGHHPFATKTISEFLDQVFTMPPDMTPLSTTHPALATVVEQLLAKAPVDRPRSAQAVITTLRTALALPDQAEADAIRESYLQAVTFVDPESKLAQLTEALEKTLHGQGSAWLIGGERGVGKSRLLDELRTQALVAGAMVLRGQEIKEGGLSYQLWRGVLPQLVLESKLSDLEASILQEVVPNIAFLLGREITPAPSLSGEAAQQRLIQTMVDIFKRRSQPSVIILEDLQSSVESLVILKQIIRIVADFPLLILASYRQDERPNLPEELPGMNVVPVKRMSETEMAILGQSMLGEQEYKRQLSVYSIKV